MSAVLQKRTADAADHARRGVGRVLVFPKNHYTLRCCREGVPTAMGYRHLPSNLKRVGPPTTAAPPAAATA